MLPFFLLFLLQLLTLVPEAVPSAFHIPQIISIHGRAGTVLIVACAVAVSHVLLGIVRGVHCLAPRSRIVRDVVAGIVILMFAAFVVASSFYAKFGAYPSGAIASDFLTTPQAFVGYTTSAAATWDTLVVGVAVVVVVLAAIVLVRRIWREPVLVRRALWNLALGICTLWIARTSSALPVGVRYQLSEHALPAAKYAYTLAALFDSNHVDIARRYIPQRAAGGVDASVPTARLVVLVLAECLRADRLPAYGYARNTTPFIQSEADRWLVFRRAYSHASRSADSFPVLFNSMYFAAIDGRRDGASAMWRLLRAHGIASAFLSSGAMEWGGISHRLALEDADARLIASDVLAGKASAAFLRSDFEVDDSVPLRRYAELLDTQFAGRRSFATIHFVGSHYPFNYHDTPDVFLPSSRQTTTTATAAGEPGRQLEVHGTARTVADSTVLRIANGFDNSMRHIDGLVRQLVAELERRGLAEDAVVMVTSDHGESLGEHDSFFHGTTLYDEEVHVPLLVRVGANLGALRTALERRQSAVVGHIDLMPTVLHLLAGSVPPDAPFEGVSLLAGSSKPYELLLFHAVGEKVAVVTEDSKYLFDVLGRRAEEYSLKNDPGEHHNLWTGEEGNVSQFFAALAKKNVVREKPDR